MLLVTSNSYSGAFKHIKNRLVVDSGLLTRGFLDDLVKTDEVLAIGGGKVMDVAKYVGSNVVACPTTASGSAMTSHSVYWHEGKKHSIKTNKPRMACIDYEFTETVPKEIMIPSVYDAMSHCFDSFMSHKATPQSKELTRQAMNAIVHANSNADYVRAGNIAGEAIEMTGTNITHCLSYALTGLYGIPHGRALYYVLPRVSAAYRFDILRMGCAGELNGIDWERVVNEAFTYDKIKEFTGRLDKTEYQELLRD